MARRDQLWTASPELLQQREQAVEMAQAGMSVRAIGEALGISHDSAARAVRNGLRMIVGTTEVELERARDKGRLETMIRSLWPDVLRGDKEAIREVRECLKRRAALLGLDATRTVKVEHVDRNAVEAEIEALAAQVGRPVPLRLVEAARPGGSA
jgi:hypothetical protein